MKLYKKITTIALGIAFSILGLFVLGIQKSYAADFEYSRNTSTYGGDTFAIPGFGDFISGDQESAIREDFSLLIDKNNKDLIRIPVDLAEYDMADISRDQQTAWEGLLTLYQLVSDNAKTTEDGTAADKIVFMISDTLEAGGNNDEDYDIYLSLDSQTFTIGSEQPLNIYMDFIPPTSYSGVPSPSSYKYKLLVSSNPSNNPSETSDFRTIKEDSFGSAGFSTTVPLDISSYSAGWFMTKMIVTDNQGKNFLGKELSTSNYFQVIQPSGIKLDKEVMKPGDTLSVSAVIEDRESNQECFLYVGDGYGTYFKQDHNASCQLAWKSSTSTAATWHTVAVTTTDAGEKITGTTNKPGVVPSPLVSAMVNVTADGTGNAVPTIGISINPSAVNQGTYGTPNVTVKATVPNPNDANLVGKECYIYMGDNAGGWLLKTRGSLTNCQLQWDTSYSSVGLHGFFANIQAAGLSEAEANPNEEPKSEVKYVRVCEKEATSCQAPTQPGDDTGTDPETGNNEGEAFNPTVNVGKLKQLSGLKPGLDTVEGIFDLLLANIFPLLIGLLAFSSIVYGGFAIIGSGGDSTKAEKGKKAIIYGVIGIFVAIFSYAIIALVVSILKKIGIA